MGDTLRGRLLVVEW